MVEQVVVRVVVVVVAVVVVATVAAVAVAAVVVVRVVYRDLHEKKAFPLVLKTGAFHYMVILCGTSIIF